MGKSFNTDSLCENYWQVCGGTGHTQVYNVHGLLIRHQARLLRDFGGTEADSAAFSAAEAAKSPDLVSSGSDSPTRVADITQHQREEMTTDCDEAGRRIKQFVKSHCKGNRSPAAGETWMISFADDVQRQMVRMLVRLQITVCLSVSQPVCIRFMWCPGIRDDYNSFVIVDQLGEIITFGNLQGAEDLPSLEERKEVSLVC